MAGARIEIPYEQYDAMVKRIDDYEKIISQLKKNETMYDEQINLYRDILSSIKDMTPMQRLMSWREQKDEINKLLQKNAV